MKALKVYEEFIINQHIFDITKPRHTVEELCKINGFITDVGYNYDTDPNNYCFVVMTQPKDDLVAFFKLYKTGKLTCCIYKRGWPDKRVRFIYKEKIDYKGFIELLYNLYPFKLKYMQKFEEMT
jgi:hypothetical protein